MSINVGFLKSEQQIVSKIINLEDASIDSKIIDSVTIKEEPLNLLFIDEMVNLDNLSSTLEQERKFYPILNAKDFDLSSDKFDSLDFQSTADLYTKVTGKWILSKNISTIEQVYELITYLRDLHISDRNNFLEELWFILKTNLSAHELTIIFNDVEEVEVADEDDKKNKSIKPKLIHSFIKGDKIPNFFRGGAKEDALMKEYESEFSSIFNITDYHPDKGHLVITASIQKSPMIILAKVKNLNQLQQSVLVALFTGLNHQS